MTTCTKEWLAASRITNTPAGDMIADMRRDPDIPPLFHSAEEMRSYLSLKGACREALATVPAAWVRYRRWVDRHPFWGQ